MTDRGIGARVCSAAAGYTAAVAERVEQHPLLLILDTHGIIFRSYFAMGDALTVRSTGEPVGAVYGFANSLLYVLNELAPTHVVAAWDAPEPTFRHEADARYKATRAPMPDDLPAQIERIRGLLNAFRIQSSRPAATRPTTWPGRWRCRRGRPLWRR